MKTSIDLRNIIASGPAPPAPPFVAFNEMIFVLYAGNSYNLPSKHSSFRYLRVKMNAAMVRRQNISRCSHKTQ